jgi:hypothetical protein
MARPKNFEHNKGCNELALKAGVSVTTVSRKLRQGKTPEQIIQEAEAFRNKEAKREKPTSETFDAAQTRKEIALANIREHDFAVKRGEFVKLSEINAWVASMILKAREILTRISPELRDRLARETDPIRIQELIDIEINRALVNLSEFKA